jgi:hypothetical protein
MNATGSITCRECGKRQTTVAARANGDRCVSKTCHQLICIFCGCTERTACFVSQRQLLSSAPDFCYFLVPGICSNPECIRLAYFAITPEEVREAQAYQRQTAPETSRPKPTLYDLRKDRPLTEGELAHIIINELLREDYGYMLSRLDVDVFDLISGSYGTEIAPLINEMFDEWNSLVGREFFVSGENLLANTPVPEGIYG